jgi:hypothetical protein
VVVVAAWAIDAVFGSEFLFHFAGDLRGVSSVFLAALLAFPFRVGKATEALGGKVAIGIGLMAGEKAYWGFATSSAAAAAAGDGVWVDMTAMAWS